MKGIAGLSSAVAALAMLLAAACGETETKVVEVEVEVVPECGPAEPFGVCDAGEACFEGACVLASSLCSPTNLSGTCTAGTSCFLGGCVLASELCSATNDVGACDPGKSCLEGACVATASLCSSGNPTGVCPGDDICQDGVCAPIGVDACLAHVYLQQPEIGVDTKSVITADGLQFKDSSGNGALDPYEDWRLSEICRARDLVSKLSVDEKVGLLMEGSLVGSGTQDGTIPDNVMARIQTDHNRFALIRLGQRTASELAIYLDNVQKVCEAEPWGIPFAITADPVHGFGMSTNATSGAQTLGLPSVVSPWPYPMGLGAINDAAVTREYGDAVRQEFIGMGFRWQLGPMADLATEPRWARVQNTFGANAFQVAKHTRACIEGFQGGADGDLRDGIAATVKHFPGAGPNERGMDSHRPWGKYNVFPGGMFEYHQISFQSAVDVGVAAVMPCYSIFRGQTEYSPEQTGAAFSYGLITEYLKDTIGFTGMVTSDWGTMGSNSAHGVEALTQPERAAMFLHAGSHQLGSDSYTIIRTAYQQGLVSDEVLDEAAEKVLEMTFKLGLFENPYTDPAATAVVRSPEMLTAGFVAQKKAIVLLKNAEHAGGNTRYLPIDPTRTVTSGGVTRPVCDTDQDGTVQVYFDGVTDALAGSDYLDGALGGGYSYAIPAGTGVPGVVGVTSAAEADIAVLRITARKGTYFGLDDGVPLSFDAPFPGLQNDSGYAAAVKDRNKVIDLLRIRDGYTRADGTVVPAANPTLKIVLVMHMDRPGIVEPFIRGLNSLDETPGVPGSYPLVSDPANTYRQGNRGVDGFLVEFGAVDRAVLDVLFNVNIPTQPEGYAYFQSRLPVEIPSSDAAVNAQFEDAPDDTLIPTYTVGAGTGY